MQNFTSYFEQSMKENKGLTFYLKGGHTVVGIVTNVIGQEAVELKSREYTKAIILMDKIIGMSI